MIYEFHPAAEAEFLESVGFYESKIRGLGAAFIAEFELAIELIRNSPRRNPVVHKPDIRSATLHRFPLPPDLSRAKLGHPDTGRSPSTPQTSVLDG